MTEEEEYNIDAQKRIENIYIRSTVYKVHWGTPALIDHLMLRNIL